jgi:hypothetical protein
MYRHCDCKHDCSNVFSQPQDFPKSLDSGLICKQNGCEANGNALVLSVMCGDCVDNGNGNTFCVFLFILLARYSYADLMQGIKTLSSPERI